MPGLFTECGDWCTSLFTTAIVLWSAGGIVLTTRQCLRRRWSRAALLGFVSLLPLAGFIPFICFPKMSPAQQKVASELVQYLEHEIDAWAKKNGRLPNSLSELQLAANPVDPWGNSIRYEQLQCPTGYSVTAAGPDRRYGSDDDIKAGTSCELDPHVK